MWVWAARTPETRLPPPTEPHIVEFKYYDERGYELCDSAESAERYAKYQANDPQKCPVYVYKLVKVGEAKNIPPSYERL
jgi:hypothetical protein